MSNGEILVISGLGFIYLALILTLSLTTYRKGYIWIFVIGFLIPPIWLLGALLKPKPGSKYKRRERSHRHAHS